MVQDLVARGNVTRRIVLQDLWQAATAGNEATIADRRALELQQAFCDPPAAVLLTHKIPLLRLHIVKEHLAEL